MKIENIQLFKDAFPTLFLSPLTSNSPTPILEQTWVSKTDVPAATAAASPPLSTTVPYYHGVVHPLQQSKEYTALTISHSAPASHQASFERGESVERTKPPPTAAAAAVATTNR